MKIKKHITPNIDRHNGYFSYLIAYISSMPLSLRIKEIYLYFRKYFLLGRIFRILIIVYNFIKTGAYFFILASVSFTLLPICAVLIVISNIYKKIKEASLNKYFYKLAKQNKIRLFFFDDPNELSSSFKYDIIIAVNKNPTSFVPYLARRIDKGFYIVSLRYYYSLKKHIINRQASNFEVIK